MEVCVQNNNCVSGGGIIVTGVDPAPQRTDSVKGINNVIVNTVPFSYVTPVYGG